MRFLFTSPVVWGGLLTAGFYAGISQVPVKTPLGTFLDRYFCSHPLEYVTAALFFLGIAVLGGKLFSLAGDRRAWRHVRRGSDGNAPADLGSRLDILGGESTLARRVRDVRDFFSARGSTDGVEDHLKYLAEVELERLHGGYSFVRTISWAIPILGFLGTVIGITIAIANVTPDQLEKSLGTVTSGLAVAFDTTALSLGLSLVLVFVAFFTERLQRRELDRVEEFAIKKLLPLFPPAAQPGQELAAAEREVGRELIARTESLLDWQQKHWAEAMDSVRGRWEDSFSRQQQTWEAAVAEGVQHSLQRHSEELRTQLQASREELAGTIDVVKSSLVPLLEQLSRHIDFAEARAALDETVHSLTAAVHLMTAQSRRAA